MRLYEISLDVVEAAKMLAQQHGVAVTLQADGPHRLELTWLQRTDGDKGSGGKFLADLVQLADQHRCEIMLAVWQGEPKLIALYQKFGFGIIDPGDQDEDPIMLRTPRSLRRPLA